MIRCLAPLIFLFFVGCAAEDPVVLPKEPAADPTPKTPIASQFQGLWHKRVVNEEDGTDLDVYLLLSKDWILNLGPDGTVGWPDSKGRTDEKDALWYISDGKDEMSGTLTRKGDKLQMAQPGEEESVFRLDAESMSRDEAIAFLAKRYKENPDDYHNQMGGRRVVLPPPPR